MPIATYAMTACMAAILASNLCFADTKKVDVSTLQHAASASTTWLEFLDKGKYAESWDHSSVIMQTTVGKDEWVKLMTSSRKPLGSLKSRQVLDQRTSKNPHGLPAGDYMVMYYKTAFAHRPEAKELVTLHLENGKWSVLTYQVE